MSIGGNDVGFGGLAAYSMTESAGDLAPVAALVGQELRFPPAVSRVYLGVVDRRLQAVKQALHDVFGVEPSRVLQSAYEPIQFDETGGLCGSMPTLGMDVQPKLKLNRQRVAETAGFPARIPEAARMHHQRQPARRLPGRPGDGRRHRLYAGHRAPCEIRQTRHMCARSEPGDVRRHHDGNAAQIPDHR